MFAPVDNMDTTEIRKAAQGELDLARLVEGTVKSPGWKVFMGIIRRKSLEAWTKDTYRDLKDFKADRKAIKLVKEAVEEFESMADAGQAEILLGRLDELEHKVPFSSLDI